jgi:hypothetical protein
VKKKKQDNDSDEILPISRIKILGNKNRQYYEFDKRILMLRQLIITNPKNKIKYAKEILECQEEQRQLIREFLKTGKMSKEDKENHKL